MDGYVMRDLSSVPAAHGQLGERAGEDGRFG